MPENLLTDEEKAERSRLSYPGILEYKFFFDHAGWGKDETDRQPEDWRTDLIMAHIEKGRADADMRARIDAGMGKDAENAITKDMPISKVRELYKMAGADYDHVPDAAIAELIGRSL